MFAPDVTESLGLVLRNQRDRFISDYYDTLAIQYPYGEAAISFTWRYVLEHVAYDRQEQHQLWRVQYNDRLIYATTTSNEFNAILDQLIASLPSASAPSSNEYRTYDAGTYDTLRHDYEPRMHSMVPVTRHRPYETMSQRYATMDAQACICPTMGKESCSQPIQQFAWQSRHYWLETILSTDDIQTSTLAQTGPSTTMS